MKKLIEFYWHTKLNMPVVFPFGVYTWRKVVGVQIGNYFIGFIKGGPDENRRSD